MKFREEPGRPAGRGIVIVAVTAVSGLVVAALAVLAAGTPADAGDRVGKGPRPAPRVLPFATKPGIPKARITKRPGKVPVTAFVDGCDHSYGTVAQCVPLTFPKSLTDRRSKCSWLAARGYGPLTVHGKDRHKLDTDRDGVACGPGDRK
jgi:hypothetical protein